MQYLFPLLPGRSEETSCPFCQKSASETGDDCMSPECLDRRYPGHNHQLVARQLDEPVCDCCGYPWPVDGVGNLVGVCVCGIFGAKPTMAWYD